MPKTPTRNIQVRRAVRVTDALVTREDIDNALDLERMPRGKCWMSISPDIVDGLSGIEAKAVLLRLVHGGQSEHNDFYRYMQEALGNAQTLKHIENAKNKKNR